MILAIIYKKKICGCQFINDSFMVEYSTGTNWFKMKGYCKKMTDFDSV